MELQEYKDEFVELLLGTNRIGTHRVLTWLENVGFFTAPASTKYHLAQEGGLLIHSLTVYHAAMELREIVLSSGSVPVEYLPKDRIIIASLLHDVCKADIYKTITTESTDSDGNRVEGTCYVIDDVDMPIGHGEKSVVRLLSLGLKLYKDEIAAIRFHMGAWDLDMSNYGIKTSFATAQERYPLVPLIVNADNIACWLLEEREGRR